jgi:hypothetical protein
LSKTATALPIAGAKACGPPEALACEIGPSDFHCGLRISDCGLKGTRSDLACRLPFNPQSAIRNPKSAMNPGGADGIRTHDLLVANQALSQLSYGPPPNSKLGTRSAKQNSTITPYCEFRVPRFPFRAWLVGPGGVEPPTSPLSGARSSQLSYEPTAPFRFQIFDLRSRKIRNLKSKTLMRSVIQFEPKQSGSALTSHPLRDAI